jgi:hypothetical protein
MLRRTEQMFRDVLRRIDLHIDTLEAERAVIAGKKTSAHDGADAIHRVLTKLNQLALDIEFELQLRNKDSRQDLPSGPEPENRKAYEEGSSEHEERPILQNITSNQDREDIAEDEERTPEPEALQRGRTLDLRKM